MFKTRFIKNKRKSITCHINRYSHLYVLLFDIFTAYYMDLYYNSFYSSKYLSKCNLMYRRCNLCVVHTISNERVLNVLMVLYLARDIHRNVTFIIFVQNVQCVYMYRSKLKFIKRTAVLHHHITLKYK